MLELLRKQDIEEYLDLLNEFTNESYYESFNREKVRDTTYNLLADTENSMVLVSKKDGKIAGLIIGTCAELLFNNDRVATDLAWYVLPKYRNGSVGIKLIKHFEYWAKEVVKADYMSMAHLGDERLSKIYTHLGYTKQEETYIQRIN